MKLGFDIDQEYYIPMNEKQTQKLEQSCTYNSVLGYNTTTITTQSNIIHFLTKSIHKIAGRNTSQRYNLYKNHAIIVH